MNEQEYTLHVFERISGGKPDAESPVLRSAIQYTLSEALKKLAVWAIDTQWRALLENDYSLTISGTSASFASNTDLLPESIKACNHITHPEVAKRFRILDSVDELDYAGSVSYSILGFAAVGASAVHFAYAASTLTGTLTVRAVKIPALSAVPVPLEHRLFDIGVKLAVEKMAEAPA